MAYEFKNPAGVDKQGYLMMMDPKKRDKWHDRFVQVKGPTLLVYKKDDCKKKTNEVRLVNADIGPQPLFPKAFQIKPVVGKIITFRTGTDKQVEDWLIALQASRGETPMDYTVALGNIRGKDVD